MLYFKSVSSLMHDVSNNLAPSNLSNLFTASDQVHNYETRFSSKGNYYMKYSRTNNKKIPFKKPLHSKLLYVLSEEDEHIDLPHFLSKIARVTEYHKL